MSVSALSTSIASGMSQSAAVQAKIALYAAAASTSNTTSQPSAYEAWKSAVVVTLSDAAKAALAAQAAGSSSGVAPINAAPPVDPAQALRAKLGQAIATLNDTSGAASIDDQLAAY